MNLCSVFRVFKIHLAFVLLSPVPSVHASYMDNELDEPQTLRIAKEILTINPQLNINDLLMLVRAVKATCLSSNNPNEFAGELDKKARFLDPTERAELVARVFDPSNALCLDPAP
jgi:hypothetical protein